MEDRLENLLAAIQQNAKLVEKLKIKGGRGAFTKISQITMQSHGLIGRLVNFGCTNPIVRVTILNLTTQEKEYAFFANITPHDAELYINMKCQAIDPPTHQLLIVEPIKMGWNLPGK